MRVGGGVGPRRNRSRRSTSWPAARYLIRPQSLDLQKPTEHFLLNLWLFSSKFTGLMSQTFHLAFNFMLNFCHKFFGPSAKILPLSGAVAKSDFTPNFWPSNALTGLERHERFGGWGLSWPRIVLDRCAPTAALRQLTCHTPRRCLATSLIYSLSRPGPHCFAIFWQLFGRQRWQPLFIHFPGPPPILSKGMCRKAGSCVRGYACMPIGISFSKTQVYEIQGNSKYSILNLCLNSAGLK